MLVLIKSMPDTSAGKRGLKMARDMTADIVLMQNGVYFALNDMIQGFCGTAYAMREDVESRGMLDQMRDILLIEWDDLIDMMAGEDKVIGAF